MIFVDNAGHHDPRLNLAQEEYLIRNLKTDDDILLFYVNEPSIIIGRNQNTLEEINQDYVEKTGIHVVRRLSGGGAVYHDLGNLCFSFIAEKTADNVNNFRKFTAPVIRVLQSLGVPAELGGRNDILVDGRKISGNAQYVAGNRMVSHGTLLLNADLSHVGEALNVKQSKIESKGIKSVRSRVANVIEFLPDMPSVDDFRTLLLKGIFEQEADIPQYVMTEADWQGVKQLYDERYSQWAWNYGHSPDFNVQKTNRFPIGEIDARIDVKKGLIANIKFYGDFFNQEDVANLEQRLVGVRYDRAALTEALNGSDIAQFFVGLSMEEFLGFIY